MRKTGKAPTHSDAQYLAYDIGAGDDFPAEVECRRTSLVVTKYDHPCMGHLCRGKIIPAGERVFRESGKCEGQFGTCYICLPCIDVGLEPDYW